jgi:hypothetical protein
MTLKENELIGQTDCLVWAHEFVERFEGFVVVWDDYTEDGRVVDTGTFIGWFANAIMAGYDEGYDTQRRDMARLKYALNQGWNRAQYEFACEKELWEDDPLAEILPAIKPEDEWSLRTVPVKVPLGDATEYEVVGGGSFAGVPIAQVVPIHPTEHLYADEDIAGLAQLIEEYRDVIGDLLTTVGKDACDYDAEEWCTEHFMGRPCSVETGKRLLNG